MTTKTEHLYLDAEADIRNTNYHEAFEKYETILYDEPGYAPAHNSMGWIYKTQFENYEKAENHLKAAIHSDPSYPHPYFHLAALLVDLERFDELKALLQKCLQVVTIEKAWIYHRYGMAEELQGRYTPALKYYDYAILNTLNNDRIKDYQADIERCKTKLDIAKANKSWKPFSE
jgi:tetratricopeptide (TPR) repeat protein